MLNNPRGLGINQTWQDVKASRALATTYTNTTNKPRMVFVTGQASAGGGYFDITVNGVVIGSSTQGYTSNALNSACFVVPPGGTYSITGTSLTVISKWFELG